MNVVKLTILCVLAKNQLLETLQLKAVTIPSSEPCRPRPIRAKPRNVLVPAKSLSESINKVKRQTPNPRLNGRIPRIPTRISELPTTSTMEC